MLMMKCIPFSTCLATRRVNVSGVVGMKAGIVVNGLFFVAESSPPPGCLASLGFDVSACASLGDDGGVG